MQTDPVLEVIKHAWKCDIEKYTVHEDKYVNNRVISSVPLKMQFEIKEHFQNNYIMFNQEIRILKSSPAKSIEQFNEQIVERINSCGRKILNILYDEKPFYTEQLKYLGLVFLISRGHLLGDGRIYFLQPKFALGDLENLVIGADSIKRKCWIKRMWSS